MSAIYEITDVVTSHVEQSWWYMEVQNDTGATVDQMEYGASKLIDTIADDVWSDLELLIEGWLDRLGERYKEDLQENVMATLSKEEEDDCYALED